MLWAREGKEGRVPRAIPCIVEYKAKPTERGMGGALHCEEQSLVAKHPNHMVPWLSMEGVGQPLFQSSMHLSVCLCPSGAIGATPHLGIGYFA